MQGFVEVVVLVFFVGVSWGVVRRHGADGAWFIGMVALAGFARENWVSIHRILYEFAPLRVFVGKAPLVATVIWAVSIELARIWSDVVLGPRSVRSSRWAGVALFMVSLAFFYEPFLKAIRFARWEPGTRTFLDVPWIAMIGYPTLALVILAGFEGGMKIRTRLARIGWLFLFVPLLAIGHGAGLAALKHRLRW